MAYTTSSAGWFASVNGVQVLKRQLPANCHYSGWTDKGPRGILLHGTAGCSADIYAVLASRQISAHFNIDRSGNIYQYVSLNDRAAHAYDANHVFFGIEHTGQNNSCKWYTQAQRASSVALSAALVEWTKKKWDTTIPRVHIEGCDLNSRGFKEHYDGAVPTHCFWNPNVHVDRPGTFWGWVEYLGLVEQKLNPPEPKRKRVFVVGTRTFNRLRRAVVFLRRTLKDSDIGESHTIRVRQQ